MPEGILEQKKGGAKNVQMKRNRKRRTLSAVKEEKKDPAEYPAGFSYSWNCASGHVDYKNK